MMDRTDNNLELADKKDFRSRYQLPDQFIWDDGNPTKLTFDGYVEIVKTMLPVPPASILDAGCGPGKLTSELIESGYKVVGVDYNERAIKFARIFAQDAELRVFDLRDLKDIHEWHGKFDAALLVEVMEHILPEFHPEVLNGIRLCLKPSGSLIITLPSVALPLNRWHYKHFTLREAKDLLEKTSFSITKIQFQHRVGFLFSVSFYRLLQNRLYDLTLLRKKLRQIYFRYFNIVKEEKKAGRFIILARPDSHRL